MKYPLTVTGLGAGKISQFSISEMVNQKAIEELLLQNIQLIENYLKDKNDKYGEEIFLSLLNNKKLNFIVNKHLELYINNNKKDLLKIFNYLLFRY